MGHKTSEATHHQSRVTNPAKGTRFEYFVTCFRILTEPPLYDFPFEMPLSLARTASDARALQLSNEIARDREADYAASGGVLLADAGLSEEALQSANAEKLRQICVVLGRNQAAIHLRLAELIPPTGAAEFADYRSKLEYRVLIALMLFLRSKNIIRTKDMLEWLNCRDRSGSASRVRGLTKDTLRYAKILTRQFERGVGSQAKHWVWLDVNRIALLDDLRVKFAKGKLSGGELATYVDEQHDLQLLMHRTERHLWNKAAAA